jgi:hypothetical protein
MHVKTIIFSGREGELILTASGAGAAREIYFTLSNHPGTQRVDGTLANLTGTDSEKAAWFVSTTEARDGTTDEILSVVGAMALLLK